MEKSERGGRCRLGHTCLHRYLPRFSFPVAFVLVLSFVLSTIPITRQAHAETFWGSITSVYYNPADDDTVNSFLCSAATELRDHLQMAGKYITIITTSKPASGSIILEVNTDCPALLGRNNEAFELSSNANTIYITGRTALAVRGGSYALLEKLGFRWFFIGPAWTVVPESLIPLDNLNEVQEPYFLARQLIFGTNLAWATPLIQKWNIRNRMYGEKFYSTGAVYDMILDTATGYNQMTDDEKRAYYLAHTDAFLPEDKWLASGFPKFPWQLNPVNDQVEQMALDYSSIVLGTRCSFTELSDKLPYASVSVTPNDGAGWSEPYSYSQPNDYQEVTDKVFSLANAVADNISTEYPDERVALLSYTWYGGIPSFALNPNILPFVVSGYNYTPVTLPERIQGLRDKGLEIGVYDFPYVWVWWADKPIRKYDRARIITYYAALGAEYYDAEAIGTGWGESGLTFYAISRMLWDPEQDFDAICNDFFLKAFGPAAGVMKHYYKTGDTEYSPEIEAIRFRDLAQAEVLAAGDEEILERIRQIEYYERFVWKYHTIGYENLDQAELEALYTFCSKIRDLNLITYEYSASGGAVEETLRCELMTRFPSAYSDNQTVYALSDFTAPTPAQASIWLGEALSSLPAVSDAPAFIDPFSLNLVPLNDTTKPSLQPLAASYGKFNIPSQGNEDITVMIKGDSINGDFKWYNPYDVLIETQNVATAPDWTSFSFPADVAGNYMLETPKYPVKPFYVDVPGHTASIVVSPGITSLEARPFIYNWQTTNEMYFNVPETTDAFTLGTSGSGKTTTNLTGRLIDPDGNVVLEIVAATDTEYQIDNPVPGVWKAVIDKNVKVIKSRIWLLGIPPLVWHDSQYLLVEAGDVPVFDFMTVTPNSASVTLGLSQQFTATGYYSDLSSVDVTGMVSWSSSNPDVAEIGQNTGMAASINTGTTNICATLSSINGTATLEVWKDEEPLPPVPELPAGVLVGIGLAVLTVYFWFQRRKQPVNNRR